MPHFSLVALVCLLCLIIQQAQARTWVVDQKHRHATDQGPGDQSRPFETINAAARVAQPGDMVLVKAGVYRERVRPERGGEEGNPITYLGAPGEEVIIKGSEVVRPRWTAVEGNPHVMTATIDPALVGPYNPFAITLATMPEKLTLGQIFVDGEMLTELSSLEAVAKSPTAWCAGPEGKTVFVHFPRSPLPPEKRLVEISVRPRVFAPLKRGLGYITVRGFIMEHCANQFPASFWSSETPQAGMLGCRAGHHWVIEHNVIRYAKCYGLDVGNEGRFDADGLNQPTPSETGHHVIRYNRISDNGAGGICGMRSTGTKIIGNIIERNNALGFTAPETAGIKTHSFTSGLIEGNLIRDNGTSGVWLDNGWVGARVTRNIIVSNSGAGLFVELGRGPVIADNNVIAFTRGTASLAGDGIYSHDASGVILAHNLIFFNANFGVWAHVATDRGARRGGGPATSSDWKILNNLILGNHRGAVSLPPETDRSRNNVCDFNLLTGGYDLLTSETYALDLDPPLFVLNTNKGRLEMKTLVDRFSHALETANVPKGDWPNLKLWEQNPLLTLAAWQLVAGYDRHSRVPAVLRPQFSPHSLVLQFLIDESPRRLGCNPVELVDRDLLGEPITAGNCLPGPFQKLNLTSGLDDRSQVEPFRGPFNRVPNRPENLNRILLWPLPELPEAKLPSVPASLSPARQ
ncbi:MAG: right-handed parallel beta-helix repeat-containing protein [Acidobacteria bacterium]|nr:MAG: right-handed parallel beta-helix repeat-containing protein [Acidobacteriota bacterium]